MELSKERLASLLAYCKLTDQADDPEVQTLIPLFYADAVGYMSGAGVALPPEDDDRRAQYDLLVNAMLLPGEIADLSAAVERLTGYRHITIKEVKNG